jgi:hypothetical protein
VARYHSGQVRAWLKGNLWRLRGGVLASRRARQLLRQPDVSILHVYGPGPREATGLERDCFIGRIGRFTLATLRPRPNSSSPSFVDDRHCVMLIVQESC